MAMPSSVAPRIRVVSIDDSQSFGTHVATFLRRQDDIEWAAQISSLQEARERIENLKPDVVMLDLSLPDGSGLDFLPELKLLLPKTNIMILTVFDEDAAMVRAVEMGCSAFMVKRNGLQSIYECVREIATTQTPARDLAKTIIQRFRRRRWTQPLLPWLTPTEARCLDVFAHDGNLRDAEEALQLTPRAARAVLGSIFRKLRIRSQNEVLRSFGRRICRYFHR
jgi:two-component system response regulator DevR